MVNLFYLAGVLLSGYAGYASLEWYFIFIGSPLMVIGYMIARAPQMNTIAKEDGLMGMLQLIIFYLIPGFAIVTSIVYFVAVGVAKLIS
jgi:hypothetical protein|tara:strand:- start:55 stop:321 length:267 start_codon:yes stop_codon:yes gene_type:complete